MGIIIRKMRHEFLLYSKEILKHFKRPKNVGKIKDPSGIGIAGNILCGDVMHLYLKIKNDRIVDAKFETFGCIVAVANSSMVTEMIKGKSLSEALKISKEDLLKKIGQPLPPIKIHCSILATDALYEALYDYYVKSKLPIPKKLEKEHKRIQRTLETIEKRYKEFIKLEKEVLK